MKIKILLAILILSSSTSVLALRFTDFEGFTDPDYENYKPKNVILLVANSSNEMRMHIEELLSNAFKKREINIISYRKLFPPTRVWSEEDQIKILNKNNIDSGLIVTIGASSASVIPMATQTYSSANVFGSYGTHGHFNATGSGTTTTHNIMKAKSTAEFSAVLLDIDKNRTVWYADIITKAGGTLFVGKKGDAKGLTKGVIRSLEENSHIKKIKGGSSSNQGGGYHPR